MELQLFYRIENYLMQFTVVSGIILTKMKYEMSLL